MQVRKTQIISITVTFYHKDKGCSIHRLVIGKVVVYKFKQNNFPQTNNYLSHRIIRQLSAYIKMKNNNIETNNKIGINFMIFILIFVENCL